MELQDTTAIANQLVDAHLFDITGPIRINYSSFSIKAGVPLVSYKDANLDLNFQDDSGAFVPAPGPSGVLQTYQVYQLRGTAQHVEF